MNCSVSQVAIRHTCTVLPSLKKHNRDNPYFDTKTKRRLIKTTGVETVYHLERHFGCKNDETLLNLYIDAGVNTLKTANGVKIQ
ncbi:hypothetical protein CQA66_08760 [Helicobacter aurati]|uniref:Uncharacterized protein n=1 Tax=Helicobacter aurati TaxID=137778 RepID=A0A3D8IXN3_9HELI|nr:hypothetical protein [Helicobacter aurati]RDU69823.1 hypothetical protein CQA66_08760 [Helicobacter aurati]